MNTRMGRSKWMPKKKVAACFTFREYPCPTLEEFTQKSTHDVTVNTDTFILLGWMSFCWKDAENARKKEHNDIIKHMMAVMKERDDILYKFKQELQEKYEVKKLMKPLIKHFLDNISAGANRDDIIAAHKVWGLDWENDHDDLHSACAG